MPNTVPLEILTRNLSRVRERMAAAAAKAGRPAEAVRLVAITKYTDAETVRALVQLGAAEIGEARVQEARKKFEALQLPGVRWHLVGHLQTNKADLAARLFDMIHSVDSLRVAQALDKERRKMTEAPPLTGLLEVNAANEPAKFGVKPETAAIAALLETLIPLSALRIAGLMTMAPYSENAEATSRPVFRKLRQLLEEVNSRRCYPHKLTELSMGMTQDYEIAIEEGATLVRVGTALFND